MEYYLITPLPMKLLRILFFMLVLSIFTNVGAQNNTTLEWKDWNTSYAKAIANKKIVMIDVYTEWCGWCKKMDRDTYANSNVVGKLNKDFVSVKFNPELNQVYYIDSAAYSGPQLLNMLSQGNPGGYPTIFFLIPKGTTIYVRSFPGYQNAVDFAKTLDEMLALASN